MPDHITPSIDIDAVWAGVLDIIRPEITATSFHTWFEHARPVELTDDAVFIVGVQNEFARGWLADRYTPRLSAALTAVTGVALTFNVIVDGSMVDSRPEADEPSLSRDQPRVAADDHAAAPVESPFNPKYTFDSFVVGDSNAFARTAALSVAEMPGAKFNPLFIFGGPGLGKTHLLHAIGHYVTENFPLKKVIYVTSEQFTNDYIDSLPSKTTDRFRQKYRSVDVLLIDDIQFLEKKEGTQEQFFHTFNELQRRGKAVVLASDRAPKDINMEERYRSRFGSGLPADIQPPNYETRLAILRRYVETEGLPIEADVLSYIADVTTPNIREMEGAIHRIGAWLALSKRPVVDLQMAKEVLLKVFPEHSIRPISIATIQRETCKFFNVSQAELVGSKRSQSIVYPRQIAMYLSREMTEMSFPKIGEEFGGRDHTTVMHAEAKIRKLMTQQRDVYNQIQQLTNVIKQKT
ncbi:MAG: chromosomal replication initiator protein DnaA [Coriobacteriia bacterium]|nr:chromosomal replication initiator protein DnaA [Coriobacteriia bacterium]